MLRVFNLLTEVGILQCLHGHGHLTAKTPIYVFCLEETKMKNAQRWLMLESRVYRV